MKEAYLRSVYENYEGDKVAYNTFRQRAYRGIPVDVAIKREHARARKAKEDVELKRYYDSYEGIKTDYETFLKRVKKGRDKEASIRGSIFATENVDIVGYSEEFTNEEFKKRFIDFLKGYYIDGKVCDVERSEQYALSFYRNYDKQKSCRLTFSNRVQEGRPPEFAILPVKVKGQTTCVAKPPKKSIRGDMNYLKKAPKKEPYIKITYTKEEADVFLKEYLRMISDIEHEIERNRDADDIHIIKEFEDKLSLVQKELEVFSKYNPL